MPHSCTAPSSALRPVFVQESLIVVEVSAGGGLGRWRPRRGRWSAEFVAQWDPAEAEAWRGHFTGHSRKDYRDGEGGNKTRFTMQGAPHCCHAAARWRMCLTEASAPCCAQTIRLAKTPRCHWQPNCLRLWWQRSRSWNSARRATSRRPVATSAGRAWRSGRGRSSPTVCLMFLCFTTLALHAFASV